MAAKIYINTRKNRGRGFGKIKQTILKRLARNFISLKDMAELLEVDEKYLVDNYSQLIEKCQIDVKEQLFQKQLELALAGDTKLLIWLGRQILGQVDKKEVLVDDQGEPRKLYGSERLINAV